MNWSSYLDPAVSGQVCLTLLHSIWQVSLLVLALWLFEKISRSNSVERGYRVNVFALFIALIALPITYSRVEIQEPKNQALPPFEATLNVAPLTTEAIPVTLAETPHRHSHDISVSPEVASQPQKSIESSVILNEEESARSLTEWLWLTPWVCIIYLLGVLLMLSRIVVGNIQANRIAAQAEKLSEGPLVESIRLLAKRWEMKIVPLLAFTDSIVVPKVVGIIRPTILLPASMLTGLSTEEVNLILQHELTHVRRFDMWINLLQRFSEAILFFNPAVWYLSRRISALREYCCDEMTCQENVTSSGRMEQSKAEQRVLYAKTLLKVAELACSTKRGKSDLASIAASGRSPSELRRRMARLLGEPLQEPLRLSRSSVLCFVVITSALLLVPAIAISKSSPNEETSESKPLDLDKPLPTITQIQNGYRKNIERLIPAYFEYQITEKDNLGNVEEHRRRLKNAQAILEIAKKNPKAFESQLKPEQIDYLIADAEQEVQLFSEWITPEAIERRLKSRVTERGSFWTDGKEFHARWPQNLKELSTSLSPGPLSPAENLNSLYKSVQVASWSTGNAPPLRLWAGNTGYVANRLNDYFSNRHLIPLGFVREVWTQKQDFHPLDKFMSEDASKYKVVEWAELNDKATIVVDGFFTEHGEKGTRVRAWIAPNQGFIPQRIEWATAHSGTSGETKYRLFRYLEVDEINAEKDEFYPLQVRQQEFVFDHTQVEKHMQGQKTGTVSQVVPIPEPIHSLGKTTIWNITKFSPHYGMGAAELALAFPKGATYHNKNNNRTYHAGNREPIPLPRKGLPAGETAPNLEVSSWLNGKQRTLAGLRGKVVVLQFMDKINVDDLKKEPDEQNVAPLRKLHHKYKDKDVEFIYLYPAKEKLENVKRFWKQYKLNAPVGIQSPSLRSKKSIREQYIGDSDSWFVLINRDGKIAFNLSSLSDEAAHQFHLKVSKSNSFRWQLDGLNIYEPTEKEMLEYFENMYSIPIDEALAQKATARTASVRSELDKSSLPISTPTVGFYIAHRKPQDDLVEIQSDDFSSRFYREKNSIITADDISSASVGKNKSGSYQVDFELSESGAKKMLKATKQNIDNHLVLLFHNKLIVAPKIKEPISRQGTVTGNISQEVAEQIAEAMDANISQKRQANLSKQVSISGRIVMPDGTPATASGEMYFKVENGDEYLKGVFTSQFSCKNVPGKIWLTYFPEGYIPVELGPFELKPGEKQEDVTIVLERGISMTVQLGVHSKLRGPGATVSLRPDFHGAYGKPIQQTTDKNGQCLFHHLDEKIKYRVVATAPSFLPLVTAPQRLEKGLPLRAWMVKKVTGSHVISFSGGSAAPHTKVRVIREITKTGEVISYRNENATEWGKLFTTTDGQGRFKISTLTLGSKYLFLFEAVDYNRSIVRGLHAEVPETQFVLPNRKDLIIKYDGDVSKLKKDREAFLKIRQPLIYKANTGEEYRDLIGVNTPLKFHRNGETGVFHGLPTEMDASRSNRQMFISLGNDVTTRQVVPLEYDRGSRVKFDLKR